MSTPREELLDAAIREHDLRCGRDHCERRWIMSCRRMPEIILSLPKPTTAERPRPLGETREECDHVLVRVYRSRPPRAECRHCGAEVHHAWVASDERDEETPDA